MSLISEALKKARQEAARQDAQRQRSPYAVGVADPGAGRTRLVPVLAGVGAGCLIAGLLLAVAWSAGWGPFARPAKPDVRVAQAAPASPPAAPVDPAAEPSAVPPARIEEQAPPRPVQSASPEPPAVQEPRPQTVSEVRTAPPAEPPAARPAPPVATTPAPVEERAPAAAAPSAPTPVPIPSAPPSSPRPAPVTPSQGAGNLVDGQTYVGEVPVPGGGAVKLNGIVFSQEQPVAMLDGRVMAPGEIIQGFTITAIEAGRVKLQGYGATVFVSPR